MVQEPRTRDSPRMQQLQPARTKVRTSRASRNVQFVFRRAACIAHARASRRAHARRRRRDGPPVPQCATTSRTMRGSRGARRAPGPRTRDRCAGPVRRWAGEAARCAPRRRRMATARLARPSPWPIATTCRAPSVPCEALREAGTRILADSADRRGSVPAGESSLHPRLLVTGAFPLVEPIGGNPRDPRGSARIRLPALRHGRHGRSDAGPDGEPMSGCAGKGGSRRSPRVRRVTMGDARDRRRNQVAHLCRVRAACAPRAPRVPRASPGDRRPPRRD